MATPLEAYRDGYRKGLEATVGHHLAEATIGIMRDDPGGYYAAGFKDGSNRKKFSPPAPAPSAPPPNSTKSTLSDLEREWYGLCNSSVFIPDYVAKYYIAALQAEGYHAAIAVGLSNFTGQACPRCAANGYFKIAFLGRIRHPDCQWSGFMGTGSYIGFQISQVFHSGIRAGGAMKDDADRKGDRHGGIVNAIVGFLFVGVFRAALAVVLIPLHTIFALFQSGQTAGDIVVRFLVLGSVLAVAGVGLYEARPAPLSSGFLPPPTQSPQSFPPAQSAIPATNVSTAPPQTDNQNAASNASAPSATAPVTPTFDCTKAHTSVELLICRDSQLALLDHEMVSSYKAAISRLSPDGQAALRREHLEWFKNYSGTCRQSANDEERATCISKFLSDHAAELKTR